MEQRRVRVISDEDLPAGIGWAFLRQDQGLTLLLTQAVVGDAEALTTALEEAWDAHARIASQELLSWPAA